MNQEENSLKRMQSMSKILIFKFALVFFLIILIGCTANASDYLKNPDEIINLFKSGSVTEIYYQFDTTMQKKLSPPRLEPIWSQMERNYGPFVEIGIKDTIKDNKSIIINTDLIFKNGIMNMMLSWDKKSKKINNFYLTEVKKGEIKRLQKKLAPEIDTTKFSSVDLEIEADYPLSAEITFPVFQEENKEIIFILNSGFGNNSKDLKIGPNHIFRNLAWGLSSLGYTVLRYDNLSYKHKSKLKKNNPNYTIFDEFINPLESTIETVKTISKYNNYKVYLVGFAEAASIITSFHSDKKIDGLVLLMGSPNKPYLVEIERLKEIFNSDRILTEPEKQLLKESKVKIDYFESLSNNDNVSIDSLPLNKSYEFLNSLEDLEPLENLKNTEKPVLIINSQNDFEVNKKNYELWFNELNNKENIKLVELEHTSHILTEINHKSTIKDYRKEAPISSIIFETINKWVKTNE